MHQSCGGTECEGQGHETKDCDRGEELQEEIADLNKELTMLKGVSKNVKEDLEEEIAELKGDLALLEGVSKKFEERTR